MTQSEKPVRFVWLDVETTGLDPQKDLLLEVALWPSRSSDPFNLHPEDAKAWVISRGGFDLAKTLSKFTWDMHSKNGLLGDVVNSMTDLADAEQQMCNILPNACLDAVWHLAGNSVHFDLGFLRAQMPTFAGRLSHRIYDVSTLALAARACGMAHEKGEPVHRALDDVRSSIRQAHAVMQWMCGNKLGPLPTLPNGMQVV